jgi:hypothetical protein
MGPPQSPAVRRGGSSTCANSSLSSSADCQTGSRPEDGRYRRDMRHQGPHASVNLMIQHCNSSPLWQAERQPRDML